MAGNTHCSLVMDALSVDIEDVMAALAAEMAADAAASAID